MSKVFKAASVLSLALSSVAALSVTDASFASKAADDIPETEILVDPALIESPDEETATDAVFGDIVFDEPAEVTAEIPADVIEADRIANENPNGVFNNGDASSLRALVAQQSVESSMDSEMECLAGTVYFESKGESLAGQLAVARVVLGRVESSRFPDTVCGVVYQRKQFSFIRGGRMPRINKRHRHWSNAVAIAKIAVNDAWKSEVEGALFFHARYVSPGWRLQRMARIDNHIFYR